MEDFLRNLMGGFAIVAEMLSRITWTIGNNAISLLDTITYGAIVSVGVGLLKQVTDSGLLEKRRFKQKTSVTSSSSSGGSE